MHKWAEPMEQKRWVGRVHSIQSLGAVDGPGLRSVVFLQGCPLRCAYCHNPDTWTFSAGEVWEAAALADHLARYRPYFGAQGGVTVSGGEPLMQAEFVAELFRQLHQRGIHTALDTSAAASLDAARMVLPYTDLVLADLKFPTEKSYQMYCKGSFAHTMEFLALTQTMKVPLWVRHVVAPKLTDSTESLRMIAMLACGFENLQKIEWLPFHDLCREKYQQLGLEFPMANSQPLLDTAVLDLLEQAGLPRALELEQAAIAAIQLNRTK